MKVLVATQKPFASVAVEGIRKIMEENGLTLNLLEKYTDKSQLLEYVADADALIVRSDKIDEEVFNAASNLKIVVRAGAGYDNIDLETATAHHVVVMNTPGQNANAVAELVFGLLVYAARNFYNASSAGTELKGKSIGIVAFGNVGRNVARIAKGFGMKVYAFDAFCRHNVFEEEGVIAVSSIGEIFKQCNVVSLHLPATSETKGCIGEELVASMKPHAILVNTARKEIINEKEVLAALENRVDLKFLTDIKPDLDTMFSEKLPGRYFSTPKKMGAQTAEANINAGLAAANQIIHYLKEGITRYQVNK